MGRRTGRDWALGLGLAAVLLAVHVGPWRAARDALAERVAYPAAEAAAAGQVALRLEPRSVVATDASGRDWRWRTPANMEYLLAAVVLIAAFPRRPYWAWLWGAHVALGALAFAAFALGVGGATAGLAASAAAAEYLAPALSIGALVVALAPGREASNEKGG